MAKFMFKRKRKQKGTIEMRTRKDGAYWAFRFTQGGKRKCIELGTVQDFPTLTMARTLAEPIVAMLNNEALAEAHEEKQERYDSRQNSSVHHVSGSTYNVMYMEQNGLCAICGKKEIRLCVDHNHETGYVRDLLCSNCNTGIGLLQDNPHLLRAAAMYLDKHVAREKADKKANPTIKDYPVASRMAGVN